MIVRIQGQNATKQAQVTTQNAKVAKITANHGERIELIDPKTGDTPKNITLKKQGDDLYVYQDQVLELVVADYYPNQIELVGADNGAFLFEQDVIINETLTSAKPMTWLAGVLVTAGVAGALASGSKKSTAQTTLGHTADLANQDNAHSHEDTPKKDTANSQTPSVAESVSLGQDLKQDNQNTKQQTTPQSSQNIANQSTNSTQNQSSSAQSASETVETTGQTANQNTTGDTVTTPTKQDNTKDNPKDTQTASNPPKQDVSDNLPKQDENQNQDQDKGQNTQDTDTGVTAPNPPVMPTPNKQTDENASDTAGTDNSNTPTNEPTKPTENTPKDESKNQNQESADTSVSAPSNSVPTPNQGTNASKPVNSSQDTTSASEPTQKADEPANQTADDNTTATPTKQNNTKDNPEDTQTPNPPKQDASDDLPKQDENQDKGQENTDTDVTKPDTSTNAPVSNQDTASDPVGTSTDTTAKAPTVTLKATQKMIQEGESVVFSVTVDNPTNKPFSVDFKLLGVDSNDVDGPVFDYGFADVNVVLDNDKLTIGADVREFDINFQSNHDQITEGKETIRLQVGNQTASTDIYDLKIFGYGEQSILFNPQASYDEGVVRIGTQTGKIAPYYKLLGEPDDLDSFVAQTGTVNHTLSITLPDNASVVKAPTAHLTIGDLMVDYNPDSTRAIVVREHVLGDEIVPVMTQEGNTLHFTFNNIPKNNGLALTTGEYSYEYDKNQSTPFLKLSTDQGDTVPSYINGENYGYDKLVEVVMPVIG